jgi:hypothetical protein
MKCIYYLAPTLPSCHRISDDLHDAGVNDLNLHVVAKDERGLSQQHVHSANYLETLDFIRDGFIGAAIGFPVGLVGIGLLQYFEPFGPDVPTFVYVVLVAAATLFGAWVGGLTGVDSENKKLRTFHAEIEAGKYLILIYVRRHQEATVQALMQVNHPEAELAGIDTHFINPFSSVKPVAEASPDSKSKVGR